MRREPKWGKKPPTRKQDPVVELPESDEDKKYRLDGEQYAKDHAAEFCAAHVKELGALISTYADGDAQEAFDVLRERFWARLWTPKTAAVEPEDPHK